MNVGIYPDGSVFPFNWKPLPVLCQGKKRRRTPKKFPFACPPSDGEGSLGQSFDRMARTRWGAFDGVVLQKWGGHVCRRRILAPACHGRRDFVGWTALSAAGFARKLDKAIECGLNFEV
jgi:hypothetical protein